MPDAVRFDVVAAMALLAQVTLIADGTSTGDACAVLDVRAAGGGVLPPHAHDRHDTTVLVVEGVLRVSQAEARRVAGPGEVVWIPRRSPCRLEASTDVHLVVCSFPAGLERLIGPVGSSVDPDDRAALLAFAGVSLLPPSWGRGA